MAALIGLALAGTVAVAVRELPGGTLVGPADVRQVEVPDALARDALPDPVGRLVVERVLPGELFRAERLLDVDKPERFTPPGTRALRVPVDGPPDDLAPVRVTLWWGDAGQRCALLPEAWVVGWGRDGDGHVDSAWVVVPAEVVLPLIRRGGPLGMSPLDPKRAGPPCS